MRKLKDGINETLDVAEDIAKDTEDGYWGFIGVVIYIVPMDRDWETGS